MGALQSTGRWQERGIIGDYVDCSSESPRIEPTFRVRGDAYQRSPSHPAI